MIELLEQQRLALQALHRDEADRQESMNRSRLSEEQKAHAAAELAQAEQQRKTLMQQHRALLQQLRQNDPDTLQAWVDLHLAALESILNTPPPPDLGVSEKSLPVRASVAKKTAEEWREILDGRRDYVHINWYFLADYERHVQPVQGG